MKNFKILNSKKVQLLILMSLVLTLTLGVYIYRGKEISLEVDGNKTEEVSYSKTVGEFLEKEEIDFQEGAYINIPLETEIESNLDIVIINPKAYVIKEKETIKKIKSIYDTADEVLKEQGIELGDRDYTEPALTERLEEEDTIEVFRVEEKVVVETSKIPFEKKREKSNTIYKGKKKLKQKGIEGELATHTKERYVNGELTGSKVVKKEVTTEKQDQIIIDGTKIKPVPKAKVEKAAEAPNRSASRNTESNNKVATVKEAAKEKPAKTAPAKTAPAKAPVKEAVKAKVPSKNNSSNVKRTLTMQATAYSTSEPNLGRYTANGTDLLKNPRVIAVDPNIIPLGTKVSIDGYGTYVAADTGGAIKGNRIDIHFQTVQQCYNFGRRNVTVNILN